jgi:hypothetical protein
MITTMGEVMIAFATSTAEPDVASWWTDSGVRGDKGENGMNDFQNGSSGRAGRRPNLCKFA